MRGLFTRLDPSWEGASLWSLRPEEGTFNYLILELARIGSQLFVLTSAACDQTASLLLFDKFATRLSAQPLKHLALQIDEQHIHPTS